MTICDYCGNKAALVTGRKIYPHRPDLYSLQFWHCEPCKAWVGCHKNSDAHPLGRLANAELRLAKSAAHREFDPLWKSGGMTRKQAYQWLSKQLGIPVENCHIGMFDVATCQRVQAVCASIPFC
ncbi:zinc-finger-containing protein [Escherichia coli]|uniref:zinc-finger-containing protein n=1 Tax=Escherichia coli TaxID=562 RepID=UPI001C4029B6|nr:zinc-finger-containing protein [Escherichia coli]